MNRTASVRVPATSANLGPGYDCAGLALDLYDELSVDLDSSNSLVIEVQGEGEHSVPRDAKHLVIRALTAGLAAGGEARPGLRLRCFNRIPHGRGLGSSSAAIVGGLALARGLLEDGREVLNDERMLTLATEIEGHPDNVAPAVLGGFTLAWMDGGVGKAIRLTPDPRLEPVVMIPHSKLATEVARGLLPAQVPHADAAANAARAALLTEALTRSPQLLLTATEDLLHQNYRESGYPGSHALMTGLRSRGIAAAISGAGPTVIAFGVEGTAVLRADVIAAAHDVIMARPSKHGGEITIRELGIDLGGVTVN